MHAATYPCMHGHMLVSDRFPTVRACQPGVVDDAGGVGVVWQLVGEGVQVCVSSAQACSIACVVAAVQAPLHGRGHMHGQRWRQPRGHNAVAGDPGDSDLCWGDVGQVNLRGIGMHAACKSGAMRLCIRVNEQYVPMLSSRIGCGGN